MSKRLRDIAAEYRLRVDAHREEELVAALTAAYEDGIEAAAKLFDGYHAGLMLTNVPARIRALSQPREPTPSHDATLAGSGAVFCDPTTLSNSQLIDTVEACQDEYDKRAGLVRVPMEMVPVDECQHPEGYTLCPICGPVTPGDFPPTPAFPLCPEHAIRLPCPACAPAALGCACPSCRVEEKWRGPACATWEGRTMSWAERVADAEKRGK